MNSKKIVSALLATVTAFSAMPFSVFAENDEIFCSGFENAEDISRFSGRGGVEVISVDSENAHEGKSCMKISGREQGWQGPQIPLDNICKAGEEYVASAWVKAAWYNDIKLSLEYTDANGERHYSNLKSAVNEGNWVQIPEVKFSFSQDVKNVYLYIEGTDKADLYVDEFVLKKAPVFSIEQEIPSLKDSFSDCFKIGTAVTTSELAPKSTKDLIDKHFNSITAGNELKPDALLDRNASIAAGNDNPQISLASARTILDYCRDNNIPMRGHVLVWHSQTPDWFFKENYADDGAWVDKETMLKRMENYIKNVFAALEEEYPTVNFYAFDVVNEAILDNGEHRTAGEQGANGSNNSAWVKIFGDNSFIEPAFEFARKYAPEGCKLYYNDFNEYMPQKTDAIIKMANDLKAKGLIDGIGLQSHLDVSFPSAENYEKALKKFVDTGLDIQITELDITTSDLSENGFKKQAEMYGNIMKSCVKYKDSISAVVLWGTTDDKSWRANRCPLLFNSDFTAKSSFYSVVSAAPEKSSESSSVTDVSSIIESSSVTDVSSMTESSSLTDVSSTTETPVQNKYDVNGDGNIASDDALIILKIVVGIIHEDDEQVKNADVNGDGNINTLDALAVLKKVVGLID